MHAPEGQVAHLPDLRASTVRGIDRPPDVIGADMVDLPALEHRNRQTVKPDIFADHRPRRGINLGQTVAVGTIGREDRLPQLIGEVPKNAEILLASTAAPKGQYPIYEVQSVLILDTPPHLKIFG